MTRRFTGTHGRKQKTRRVWPNVVRSNDAFRIVGRQYEHDEDLLGDAIREQVGALYSALTDHIDGEFTEQNIVFAIRRGIAPLETLALQKTGLENGRAALYRQMPTDVADAVMTYIGRQHRKSA